MEDLRTNIIYGKVFVIIFISDSKLGAMLGYETASNPQKISLPLPAYLRYT